MKKKFLALVLTLAMVLSLAPVGALATNGGEESQTPEDVIYDDTAHSGNATVDGVDSLNKTAKKTGENTYEVKLEVKMHETTSTISQAAATVLVIDVSSSMNDPTCGKEEHTHTDRCYTTHKKCTREDNPGHWTDWGHKRSGTGCTHIPFEGWFYQIDPILSCTKEVHTHTSSCYPIDAAKKAAKSFVDTYAGNGESAGRYLSIVVFGTDAYVKLDWIDVSTVNGKASATSAIDEISANGGTNLEQGLAKAKDQFTDQTVASVNFKNVVALTDGAPTFYGEGGWFGPSGSGSSGSKETNDETAETAEELKEVANLYTVCFGAENMETYRGGPTVGNFLRDSIATDSNHAYDADNAGALNNAFKEISKTITSGISAGVVHDALPTGVSSAAFGENMEADWNLSEEGGFTCNKTTNAETGRTDYVYTKTYTVTINPDEIDSTVLEEKNGYYPLNEPTTLTVKVKEGDEERDKVLNFPIPLAYVKRTDLSYTVNYLEKDTNEVVKSAKTADDQTFGATISAADEVIDIDGYTYDSADKDTLTIGTGENVINLYYVKRANLSYTVNYLEKDTNEVVKSAKTADDQTFGATISAADEVIAIDGYTYDSADPATLTIGTSSNVINLYYTKATVYKITICYINDTGTSIKEAKTIPNKHEGDPYDVESEDYIPARIGDYIKESVPSNVKGTMGKSDVTITVVYTKDVLVDSTVIPKPDGPGDNIPDKYQVIVKYVPDTTGRGTVGQLTEEVLTIYKDNEKKEWASTGTVTATGSTATANGGRNYFSNWTNDAKVDTSKEPATLGQQTIKNAKGGATYTFTANFGYSGGGSGGSNRPKPPVVEIPDDVPTGLNGKDHYAYVVGYPDGMVYPQKNITRAEVATIFFRLLTDETREANMTKSNSYNDMKDGAWYTCAVSTLSKMGIIKGYEDGSFKPDASISRAEFAAIAARFDPDGDKTPATFSDVSSHWAKDEISIAANHGWIKGYEDGSFKPDQKITRAETMTLVNRVLKRLPETKDDLHKDMKTWPDNQNESAWFYLAVQEATNSHYQKLKKDGIHETWESMRETRDWAALEK